MAARLCPTVRSDLGSTRQVGEVGQASQLPSLLVADGAGASPQATTASISTPMPKPSSRDPPGPVIGDGSTPSGGTPPAFAMEPAEIPTTVSEAGWTSVYRDDRAEVLVPAVPNQTPTAASVE